MSDYIFNPETGRNVLRSGKIGKRLIKEQEQKCYDREESYEESYNREESYEESYKREESFEEIKCNICINEKCFSIKKCKRCNFYAGNSCINNWHKKTGNKSCPGCRHNFVTGKAMAIDFADEITQIASRLVANPPRNGHILEDVGHLMKEVIIEKISDPENLRNLIERLFS